ncbi:MAG TPA: FtsX-like permease family protein [Actinoplanes sp.]|nr:FtsX-like permease family protein [Actinoplanes sp.]
MIRPRTAKLARDLWQARGRVALMMIAIVVALSGVGAMLVARSIILQDAQSAYTATNPASATLDVPGGVDAALLAQVRRRPGVADAAARQTITTRVRVGDEWRRMLLFVVAPDDRLNIARFTVRSGSWPAPDDGMLVERAAVSVLGADRGGTARIAGPDGTLGTLRITGTVHDPALAPAPQERTGYGYLTPAAAARLGWPVRADLLKIVVAGPGPDGRAVQQSVVDRAATEVATWLTGSGHPVHQIDAPPYRHPHQNQTDTVTALFLAFALATLALAGVLMATTLGALLAGQTRQLAVMKTVGGTTGQLLRLYLAGAAGIAATGTAVALVPALLAGQGLAGVVAELLNIDLTGRAVPAWVFAAVIAAGIGVPLAVASPPLIRASRMTVCAALADQGTGAQDGSGWLDRRLTRIRGTGGTTALAVRNMLRRRTRLALTLALLAAGGALFTGGLSTAGAWQAWVDDGMADRRYDAELTLARPAPANAVLAGATGADRATAAETTLTVPVTPAAGQAGIAVQRTYPDGGHGRFNLTALAPATAMTRFDLRAGRWLRAGDTDAVVLNQGAATRLGDPAVGATVQLTAEGRRTVWRVVGLVTEVGGPATGYTATGALDQLMGAPGLANGVRVTGPGSATAAIEAELAGIGVPVAAVTPTDELRSALDEHVVIFIYTLVALAVVMAVVGVLGLGSTMSIAVTERTRELGIMRAVGATPAAVRRLVLAEGVLTGLVGGVLAVALGVPTAAAVGAFLGRLSFGTPLPLHLSYPAMATWLVIALVAAATATLAAARRAARLTVRETLSHE